ncbi:MAG: L,D-transpeptidase family protein, partial [Flavobacterium sp.]
MRNLSFLIIIITSCFLFSSFSLENENKYTAFSSANTVKITSLPQNSASETAIDSLLIADFFKKHSNLKTYQEKVADLYRKRGYSTIWLEEKTINEFGYLLHVKVDLLKEKGIENVMPYESEIDKFFTDNAIKKTSQSDADILLTTMFVFYADNISPDVDAKRLKKAKALPSPKNIAYERILDSLIFKPEKLNKEHLLFGQYDKLKGMLAKYQNIEKKNLWKKIAIDSATYKNLKPLDTSDIVRQVREHLFVVGDLKTDSKSNIYDEELMAGVLNYKKRCGLKLNYTLTLEHINQMNEPISNRIRTIVLNMERCRFIPGNLAEANEYVMVNIPSFKLFYVRDNKYELVSDVFVGAKWAETEIFSSMMDKIVFSPYWNVPQSIIDNELKLNMASDKNYLEEHNMEWN